MLSLRSCFIPILAGLAACQTVAPPAPVDLAITDVTVIEPGSGEILPSRSVYVDDGRIVAVEPPQAKTRRTASRTVDGQGKYLIPGLVDMHVHLFLPEPAEPKLALLLANGVTGIREMSGDCWAAAGAKKGCIAEYRQLQSAVANGQIAGPELMSLTSTMVMGPTRLKLPPSAPAFIAPVTAEQAKVLVAHLVSRGVDEIKTHDSISSAAFTALMRDAKQAGIPVVGHVPFGAGSLGAARLGYRSIEHARDLLYDCSRYGPEYRQQEAAVVEGQVGAKRPTSFDRLTRTMAEYDPQLCQALVRQLADTGIYYVPTHVTREMEARADEAAYLANPNFKYILPERQKRWNDDFTETAALPEAERLALDRFFEHGLRITRLAQLAGIPVMAGTDMSDTGVVPGFSLHRELSLLRRAGLSNLEVLRAATSVPAAYFGRPDLGEIAEGAEADLVLLTANPLDDIRNTRSIEAVVSNGRLFNRAMLDALLRSAETAARPR